VIARAEQLRKSIKELEESYDITLEALGASLDLKEAQTERHSKRVTAYAIGIAKTMGISPDEIRVIARGAFLHDIGKMAIPDQILTKPARLTRVSGRSCVSTVCADTRLLRKFRSSLKRQRSSTPTKRDMTGQVIPAV